MRRRVATLALVLIPALARAQPRDELNAGSAWRWAGERASSVAVPRPAPTPPPPAPAPDDDDPWSRVAAPTRPPSEAIGFYSRGCLRGAVALSKSGVGYEKMRLARRRGFGHPRLIAFLRDFGARVAADPRLGTLLIGDMAYPRGGPFKTGHKSHQSGLDVDVWFRQAPAGTRVSDRDREAWGSPELVENDADGFYLRLNARWDPRELDVLRLAATDPQVERIFVNPVIKKTLCAAHPGEAWTAKVRAEWGHEDHFHVRLHCAGAACEPQTPVTSDGCATLDAEWFGPSARAEWRKSVEDSRHPKPWTMPKLPAACSAVLAE